MSNIKDVVPYVGDIRKKSLDIGCGNGERFCWMQDFAVQDMCGVSWTKSSLWLLSEGVKVSKSNLSQGGIPLTASFDVVILNHVLEHLHHPQLTLRECK